MVWLDISLLYFKLTDNNEYYINFKNPKYNRDIYKFITGYELIILYKDLVKAYPIIPIGETFYQYYCFKWSNFIQEVGGKVYIIEGGDITRTNFVNIRQAEG